MVFHVRGIGILLRNRFGLFSFLNDFNMWWIIESGRADDRFLGSETRRHRRTREGYAEGYKTPSAALLAYLAPVRLMKYPLHQ